MARFLRKVARPHDCSTEPHIEIDDYRNHRIAMNPLYGEWADQMSPAILSYQGRTLIEFALNHTQGGMNVIAVGIIYTLVAQA